MTYPQSLESYASEDVIILLGNGDGSFKQSTHVVKYSEPQVDFYDIQKGVSDFADYNRDGNGDMLVYDFWKNGFYLYDGNGLGFMTFDPPEFYSCSIHGYEAFFIDYDKDGDLDIVSACSGSAVSVTLHIFDNENNSFKHSDYQIEGQGQAYAYHLQRGDANGDGRMDFFMPTNGGFTLATQNEDKSFTMKFFNDNDRWQSGHNQLKPHKLLIDVNNDGMDDVIASGITSFTPTKYKLETFYASPSANLFDVTSNSDITSPEIKGILSRYFYGSFLNAHDMDRDSNTDIIFVQSNGDEIDSLVIVLDPFDINKRYEVKKIPLGVNCATETGRGFVFADFDNDAMVDICFLGSDDKVRVILNSTLNSTENIGLKVTEALIYPNPNSGHFKIDPKISLEKIKFIQISNLKNQIIFQNEKPINHEIEIENISKGIYFLNIQLSNEIVQTKFIVR